MQRLDAPQCNLHEGGGWTEYHTLSSRFARFRPDISCAHSSKKAMMIPARVEKDHAWRHALVSEGLPARKQTTPLCGTYRCTHMTLSLKIPGTRRLWLGELTLALH